MNRISPAERLARDLDWNLLRVFLALAEAGSVTAAASRLSLKQPSVSSALKPVVAATPVSDGWAASGDGN